MNTYIYIIQSHPLTQEAINNFIILVIKTIVTIEYTYSRNNVKLISHKNNLKRTTFLLNNIYIFL